jgi:dihydroneopterin aldolase
MSSSVEITLRNMQFHVCVGVLPHERELPQPLAVDLTVWTASPADDAIAVDYRDLHRLTAGVLATQPLLYLETVARTLLREAMAQPAVIGARIAVRKPHVALPGTLDCAEIVVQDGVRA